MIELWLKFKDEKGNLQKVLADKEKFTLGRHSENDLSFSVDGLSRKHAEIKRFGDGFILSDIGSSNGTFVNDENLKTPVILKEGDKINLGGGLEIEVEIVSKDSENSDAQSPPSESAEEEAEKESAEQSEIASEVSGKDFTPAIVGSSDSGSSIPKSFFIIAPVLVIVILLFAGGLLFLFGGRKEKDIASGNNDFTYSDRKENRRSIENDTDEDATPTPTPKQSTNASETPSNSIVETPQTPSQNPSELDKLERNALSFMRRIALNDDNYVFTRKQLSEINGQIKSFRGSTSLRDNLKTVKQNASQFEEMAKSKGLKSQFLATAALAKGGNPLATAQAMLSILGELKITLGNELSDENLLIIAAYNQGENGDFRAMRTTLEVFSKQTQGVASNKIRTVWFLRERGKLSDAQYAFVLRFLAIGAITQNPRDFNVETEAVAFN